MKKMKRILTVMLAVMLMSVSFSLPAFAADETNVTPDQLVNQQQDDQQQDDQQQDGQQQEEQQPQTTNFEIKITMPNATSFVLNYPVEVGKSKYVSLADMLKEKGYVWDKSYSVDPAQNQLKGEGVRYVFAGEVGKAGTEGNNPFFDVMCGIEMTGKNNKPSSSSNICLTDKITLPYYVYDYEEQLDGTWKIAKQRIYSGDGTDENMYGEKFGYLVEKQGVKVGQETAMVMTEKDKYIRFTPFLYIHFNGKLLSGMPGNGDGDGNFTDEWPKGSSIFKFISTGNSDSTQLARFGYKYDEAQSTFVSDGAERSLNFMPIAYNNLALIRPVHFDANGGKGKITSVNAYTGAKVARDIDGCKYDANGNKTTEKADEADGMTRDGYKFIAWNTKADGSGTSYKPGEFFVVPAGEASYTLYAQWESNTPNPPIIIPVDPNPPVVIEDDDTPQDEVPDVVEPVEEEVIGDEDTPLAEKEEIIDDEDTPLAEGDSNVPKTGDNSPLGQFVLIGLLSATGLVALQRKKAK